MLLSITEEHPVDQANWISFTFLHWLNDTVIGNANNSEYTVRFVSD